MTCTNWLKHLCNFNTFFNYFICIQLQFCIKFQIILKIWLGRTSKMVSGSRISTFLIGIILLVLNDKVINASSNDIVDNDVGGLFHFFFTYWNYVCFCSCLKSKSFIHFYLYFFYHSKFGSHNVLIVICVNYFLNDNHCIHFAIIVFMGISIGKSNICLFHSEHYLDFPTYYFTQSHVRQMRVFGNPSFSHILCCHSYKFLSKKSILFSNVLCKCSELIASFILDSLIY